MNIEEDIRLAGFDKQVVLSAFRFKNLEPDFIREVVESKKAIKKELEHELSGDIHRYSVHASAFYQNMYIYLKLNLAQYRELKCYSDRVGQMYMDQWNKEQQSRQTYQLIDNTGRILQEIIK